MFEKEREAAVLEIQEDAKRRGQEIDHDIANHILDKYTASEEKLMLEGDGDEMPKGLL